MCECFTASRSCLYTCFFALKRPCMGPLTPQVFFGFLNLGAILANSLPAPPPPPPPHLYPQAPGQFPIFRSTRTMGNNLFERCTFKVCKGTMFFSLCQRTLETLDNVKQEPCVLPDPELYIILNGKPTKSNVVWRSLVNVQGRI